MLKMKTHIAIAKVKRNTSPPPSITRIFASTQIPITLPAQTPKCVLHKMKIFVLTWKEIPLYILLNPIWCYMYI